MVRHWGGEAFYNFMIKPLPLLVENCRQDDLMEVTRMSSQAHRTWWYLIGLVGLTIPSGHNSAQGIYHDNQWRGHKNKKIGTMHDD